MFAQGRRRIGIHTARENNCVLIESPDDGHGVPKGVRDLAFELIFTTKDVGKGTGIGLDANPIVIVHYGGDIRFTSEPCDTRFEIRLPTNGSFDGKATRNIVWSPVVGQ
jgi:signal transduction histidine kinase